MQVITITKEKSVFVDDEDFDLVSKYRWYLHTQFTKSGREISYATSFITLQNPLTVIQVQMHNVIMKTPTGSVVHHKNGCGLDNRKQNLVICTWKRHCTIDGRNKMEFSKLTIEEQEDFMQYKR